jgi:hypothetical protein
MSSKPPSRQAVGVAAPSGCNPRPRRTLVKRAPRHHSPRAVTRQEKRVSGSSPPGAR